MFHLSSWAPFFELFRSPVFLHSCCVDSVARLCFFSQTELSPFLGFYNCSGIYLHNVIKLLFLFTGLLIKFSVKVWAFSSTNVLIKTQLSYLTLKSPLHHLQALVCLWPLPPQWLSSENCPAAHSVSSSCGMVIPVLVLPDPSCALSPALDGCLHGV